MVDRISVPITFNTDDKQLVAEVTRAFNVMRGKFGQEMSKVLSASQRGDLPGFSKVRAEGRQRFRSGGKEFEVSGTGQARLPTAAELQLEQSGGVTREQLDSILTQVSMRVREVRSKMVANLRLDERRLSEFKKSLRFQPLKIRKEMITDFLKETERIQSSLQNLLPTEQLSAIQQSISSSPSMSKGLIEEYTKDIADFQQSIQDLSPDEQVQAIDEYVKQFTEANLELRDRLALVTTKIERQRFDALRTKIKGLSPERQASAVEEYKRTEGALLDEANALTREISEKFRQSAKSRVRTQFETFKAEIEELPTEERLRAYQKWIDEGKPFPREVRKEMRKLEAQQFKEVKIEIAELPVRERAEKWREIIADGNKFAARFSASARRELEGAEFGEFQEQIAPLPLKEQIEKMREYVARGNRFSKQMREQLRKTEGLRFTEIKEEINLLPVEDRNAQWQQYIDEGGKFVNRARAEISRNNKELGSAEFNEAKLAANALPIEDREAFWQKYIDDGKAMGDAANNELMRAKTAAERNRFQVTKLQGDMLPYEQRAALWARFFSPDPAIQRKAQAQLNRAKFLLDKQEFDALRSRAVELPFEERVRLFQAYADGGGRFAKAARTEARRNYARAQAMGAKAERLRIAELPFDDQEAAWLAYTQRLNTINNALRRFTSGGRVAGTAPRVVGAPNFEQMTDEQIGNVIRRNEEMIADANRRRTRAGRTSSRSRIREVREMNVGKEFDEQIANWNALAAAHNDLVDFANGEIEKLRRRRFSRARTRMRGRTTLEQINELEALAVADPALRDTVDTEIRELRRRRGSRNRTRRNQRWRTFFEQLREQPMTDQLSRLEAEIGTIEARGFGGTPLDRRDTENLAILRREQRRTRARRDTLARQAANTERQRRRDIGQNVMMGAAAGLGVLGPAGFPLLNVGFAAMGGNLAGAGIVAFTTALGEAGRAVNTFSEANKTAAREIGFISTRQKMVEAQATGISAALGQNANTIAAVGLQQRNAMWQGAAARGSNIGEGWERVKEGFKQTFLQLITEKPSDWLVPGDIATRLDQQFRVAKPAADREALNNLRMNLNRPTVGIETDPLNTFRRMQTAAFDPMKSEERRIQTAMLKAAEETAAATTEMNKTVKAAEEARARASSPQSALDMDSKLAF